jgi:hypothetical protein
MPTPATGSRVTRRKDAQSVPRDDGLELSGVQANH